MWSENEPMANTLENQTKEAFKALKDLSKGEPIMKVKTLTGLEIELNRNTLNGLKMRLRGPVLLRGDIGYEDSRTVWNAMIDRKLAFVVRCIGVADGIECVQFSREHNLLLCIKDGGHNIAGLATSDGAMMLDMSLMRGVWVDAQRKVAHA